MTLGLCECGCGGRTPPARETRRAKGWFKGLPLRFIPGHQSRRPPAYVVDPATGCWNWTRAFTNGGYGTIFREGRRTTAHRFMWETMRGPIPPHLQIDHLCRNRRCVNPRHLELVTPGENTRRGYEARRAA